MQKPCWPRRLSRFEIRRNPECGRSVESAILAARGTMAAPNSAKLVSIGNEPGCLFSITWSVFLIAKSDDWKGPEPCYRVGGNLRAVVFAGAEVGVLRHGCGPGWVDILPASLVGRWRRRADCENYSFYDSHRTLARVDRKRSCTFGQKWYRAIPHWPEEFLTRRRRGRG